mmetsp:Transcript_11533/g.17196  ORF Transcript_11533/g.17196 Transcript_11533/m.17196 type:complete len:138 (-) Transcript_11533:139-552(-)
MESVSGLCSEWNKIVNRNNLLFRGLYAFQLHRCYKNIAKDKILILSSNDLKNKPDQVLSQASEFLGVPHHNFSFLAGKNDSFFESVIEQKYNAFGVGQGWKYKSEHEEISLNLKSRLNLFFEPHNEMLFEMIGQELF